MTKTPLHTLPDGRKISSATFEAYKTYLHDKPDANLEDFIVGWNEAVRYVIKFLNLK